MEGYRQSKKNATAARPRSYKIDLIGFVKAIYVE
jgi:hypothetical protein